MNTDNENNTKELELGQDTTPYENKKESTGEAVLNDKPTNSFYDGGSNNSDTKWTQDWRGKSLFLFLAFLIVLAVTIPSGMAIAGYFKDELETPSFEEDQQVQKVKRDIQYLKNEAIADHFEQMYNEGWFNKRYYDTKVEDISNDADSTISDEKDALKKEYGNTWETEWNKSLNEKGFDSEEAYKSSLLSASYKNAQLEKYTNQVYLKGTTYTTSTELPSTTPEFVSTPTASNRVSYINNDETVANELKDRNSSSVEITISPEDLMKSYIYFYEPVLFNSSVVPFTPNDATGTASIDMSTITLTKENIISMWHLLRAGTNGTYQPQTSVEGTIQSRSNINISAGANAAIYAYLAGDVTKDGGLETAIASIETTSGPLSVTTSLSDINAMSTTQVDAASTAFAAALTSTYAATGSREYAFTETIKTSHPTNPAGTESSEDIKYLSYMDVDGIHMLGLQDFATAELKDGKIEITDDSMVANYLDTVNESGNYQYIPEEGLISSYTSWVTTNFDNIILFDYIAREDDLIKEHMANSDITNEEYVKAFRYYIENKVISNFNARYYEVDNFYSTNRKIFDYEAFKSDLAYIEAFLGYNLAKDIDALTDIIEGLLPPKEAVSLPAKGGGDNE